MNTLYMTVSDNAINDFVQYMQDNYFPGYSYDDLFTALNDKCNISCAWNFNSQDGINGLIFDYLALQNVNSAFKPFSVDLFQQMIDRLDSNNLIFTPIADYPEPLLAKYLIVAESYSGEHELITVAPFMENAYSMYNNACDSHDKMNNGESVRRILLVKTSWTNTQDAKVVETHSME